MINDKFAYIDRSVQKTTENYLDISESVLRIETLIAEKEELIANKKALVLYVQKNLSCRRKLVAEYSKGIFEPQRQTRAKSGSTSPSQC
uniref:Uncharacterized protein n=1 Tax=Ditylenchus dipsaci TaxID=166011 RepID=A0A915E8K5_9BILA